MILILPLKLTQIIISLNIVHNLKRLLFLDQWTTFFLENIYIRKEIERLGK